MQNQPEQTEEIKPVPKVYSYFDLLQFESPSKYSGFGKMVVSTKPSAPKFGFGTADRQQQAKVFQSKALSKTFVGKNASKHAYPVTDKFTYNKAPEWKFGLNARNTLDTGSKYDFYERQEVDFDPLAADSNRRWKSANVRIGLESRFPNDPKRQKGTPGPQYDPSLKHEIPHPPKFSFGFRRQLQGQSPLANNASTGEGVGPGSYFQGTTNLPLTSEINKNPSWYLPKAKRLGLFNTTWDKNQTYDTKSRAIGTQFSSKKKTMPAISFGKANRDYKVGTFKDMMATQPTKIRIDHPKF